MNKKINQIVDRLNRINAKDATSVSDQSFIDRIDKYLSSDKKPLAEVFHKGMLKAIKTAIEDPAANDVYSVCKLNANNWYELGTLGSVKNYYKHRFGVVFRCNVNAHNIPIEQLVIIRWSDPAQKMYIMDQLRIAQKTSMDQLVTDHEL